MPGPGTGEWDGGWSMFTLLLPAEHIPTTESWRLFNLQNLDQQQFPSGEFSHNNTGLTEFNFMKRCRIRPLNLAKVMLKSSAEAKSRHEECPFLEIFFLLPFLAFYSVVDQQRETGNKRRDVGGERWLKCNKGSQPDSTREHCDYGACLIDH